MRFVVKFLQQNKRFIEMFLNYKIKMKSLLKKMHNNKPDNKRY